jgi:hypothetical protein
VASFAIQRQQTVTHLLSNGRDCTGCDTSAWLARLLPGPFGLLHDDSDRHRIEAVRPRVDTAEPASGFEVAPQSVWPTRKSSTRAGAAESGSPQKPACQSLWFRVCHRDRRLRACCRSTTCKWLSSTA